MKNKALRSVLTKVNKACEAEEGFQHGIGKLSFADEYTPGEVKLWIPSGINLVDFMLGGGLPVGRVVELFSEHESEGKTTLALHFMAQLQRYANGGGLGLWLEQETAMDKERAEHGIGVDTKNLFIDCPHSVEDAFVRIWKWLDAVSDPKEGWPDVPKLIVWDTVAAATTRAGAAGNQYAGGMSEKPRIISENLRGLVQRLYKCNATFLVLNQSYTVIGGKNPFPTYEQPGGKGLKYYSSIRFKVSKRGHLAEAKTVKSGKEGRNTKTGILPEIETVKNKTAPPFRSVRAALNGYHGYNNPLSYAHFYADMKMADMVSPAGAYYRLAGAEKCVKWADIAGMEQDSEQWAPIHAAFCQRAVEMFPLPPDRRVNPKTGWVEKIEGVEQFVSSGDGDKAMSEEDIARASEKVKRSKKSAKKKVSKKKS